MPLRTSAQETAPRLQRTRRSFYNTSSGACPGHHVLLNFHYSQTKVSGARGVSFQTQHVVLRRHPCARSLQTAPPHRHPVFLGLSLDCGVWLSSLLPKWPAALPTLPCLYLRNAEPARNRPHPRDQMLPQLERESAWPRQNHRVAAKPTWEQRGGTRGPAQAGRGTLAGPPILPQGQGELLVPASKTRGAVV